MHSNQDTLRSMLVGVGIGDALGAAFEMIDHRSISVLNENGILEDYREGLEGSIKKGRHPGQVTDDTAMTISVARTLKRTKKLAKRDDYIRGFQQDLVSGNDDVTGWFAQGNPGIATMKALEACATGITDVIYTKGYEEAGGNGTIMRVSPTAILNTSKDVKQSAREQAKATHGHLSAIAAAEEVALRLYRLIHNLPIPKEPLIKDFLLLQAWKRYGNATERELYDVPMTAWETAAAAWRICENTNWDPARAISFAATSGGDTDTIASVVGAFIGAYVKDVRAFPGAWLHGLVAREALMDLADELTLL